MPISPTRTVTQRRLLSDENLELDITEIIRAPKNNIREEIIIAA